MTKAQKAAKELKALQKKNYEEMLKTISNFKNPTQKDIDYMQGIMKGKKYNRKNRTELTRKLAAMEAELPTKAAEVADKAKALFDSAPGGLTSREDIFEDVRKDLRKVAEKASKYARVNPGGTGQRLSTVARNCERMARVQLRDV